MPVHELTGRSRIASAWKAISVADVLASKPRLAAFLDQNARTRGVDDTLYLIAIFTALSREYSGVIQAYATPAQR